MLGSGVRLLVGRWMSVSSFVSYPKRRELVQANYPAQNTYSGDKYIDCLRINYEKKHVKRVYIVR